jgi:hypothetical protein
MDCIKFVEWFGCFGFEFQEQYLMCALCQVYFKQVYLITFFPYTAVVYVMKCSWLFA